VRTTLQLLYMLLVILIPPLAQADDEVPLYIPGGETVFFHHSQLSPDTEEPFFGILSRIGVRMAPVDFPQIVFASPEILEHLVSKSGCERCVMHNEEYAGFYPYKGNTIYISDKFRDIRCDIKATATVSHEYTHYLQKLLGEPLGTEAIEENEREAERVENLFLRQVEYRMRANPLHRSGVRVPLSGCY